MKYKETFLVFVDVVACLLLIGYGWVISYHFRHDSWRWLLCLAAFVVTLIAVTAMRNHSLRGLAEAAGELIEAQRKLIDAGKTIDLATANRRLSDVALSAVALMTAIEHGIPPNLSALKRDLAALGAPHVQDKPNGAAKP
jgi:ABC-type iron transport system FetAB permease component